ncbi:hypothetical protein ACFLUP_00325 [Chloroflexota bacterium]
MEKANDRRILSIALSCLKNMALHVKPGRQNTRIKPNIALKTGNPSMKENKKPKNSLTGNNQSMLLIPLY